MVETDNEDLRAQAAQEAAEKAAAEKAAKIVKRLAFLINGLYKPAMKSNFTNTYSTLEIFNEIQSIYPSYSYNPEAIAVILEELNFSTISIAGSHEWMVIQV